MQLTRTEKERISDSRHKIQSVTKSLREVDPKKVEDFQGIQDCLQGAEKNLGKALRSSNPPESGRDRK
jgi:hypothetical protein